jgi:hypothetical protein
VIPAGDAPAGGVSGRERPGPLLVLVAVRFEARGLARRLFLADRAGRGDVLIRTVGLGTAELPRLAPALVALRPRAVLVTGLAGGCAPDVGPGEILLGSRVGPTAGGAWMVPDASVAAALVGAVRAARLPHRVGPLVTVAEVAATPEAKAVLWRTHQALGVDMESAHVLEWAAGAGLPAAAARAVADGPRDGLSPALLRAVTPDGRPRWSAVAGWVATPGTFAAAWRIRRQASLALDRLARVIRGLGAWLP